MIISIKKYIYCLDGSENPIICNIVGNIWDSTCALNIDELPPRCDVFQVSQYAFDLNDGVDTYIVEEDKSNYRQL